MSAERLWSFTVVVLLTACACLFIEPRPGLALPCWECRNDLTCTAYECYHEKDISDPDSLKEMCDPKRCIKSVVYFYHCAKGKDPSIGGDTGCFAKTGTNQPAFEQTVYDNKLGDYTCGPNVWASVPGCPPQSPPCACGFKYTAFFFGTPQGRCFTRPCDGNNIGSGGETGRDDCSRTK